MDVEQPGADSFLELSDTPPTYSGQALNDLNVNAGETGLEFSADVDGVSDVSNSDGTLTISPTTGDVVASLNLGNANTWTALQTFGANLTLASDAPVLTWEDTGGTVDWTATNDSNILTLASSGGGHFRIEKTDSTSDAVLVVDRTGSSIGGSAGGFADASTISVSNGFVGTYTVLKNSADISFPVGSLFGAFTFLDQAPMDMGAANCAFLDSYWDNRNITADATTARLVLGSVPSYVNTLRISTTIRPTGSANYNLSGSFGIWYQPQLDAGGTTGDIDIQQMAGLLVVGASETGTIDINNFSAVQMEDYTNTGGNTFVVRSKLTAATDKWFLHGQTADSRTEGDFLFQADDVGIGLGLNDDFLMTFNGTGMVMAGQNATNNENLIWDFETTANTVGVSTSTGVTLIDFGSLNLKMTDVEIDGDLNHDGTNVGFYAVAPVARPAAYTQTYTTTSRTANALTSSALTDSTGGTANTTLVAISGSGDDANINNNFADLAAMVNSLITDVINIKSVQTQVIDDFQLNGLLQ